jgi:hypothetical protein
MMMMLVVYLYIPVCVVNTTRKFWGIKELEIHPTDFLRVQQLYVFHSVHCNSISTIVTNKCSQYFDDLDMQDI